MTRPPTPQGKDKWAAQRQEKLTALQGQLADGLQQLMEATGWMTWLKVAHHFHTYSLNNQILIAIQNPAATQVTGYRTWQATGRQVRKGEKGISILAPVTAPRSTPDGQPLLDAHGTQLRGIIGVKPATVFDIAQTDGPPLPHPDTEPRALLEGQAPEGMWNNLEHYASQLGFTVHVGNCPAEGLTHFLKRDITILHGLDPAHAASVLAHEVGHATMHDPDTAEKRATIPCRGLVEVEAESFAWLVNNDWGLDSTPDSFHYLAGWSASAAKETKTTPLDILTATATRVRAATTRYLDYRHHHHQAHPVTELADTLNHDTTQLENPMPTHRTRALHELNHSPTRPATRTP